MSTFHNLFVCFRTKLEFFWDFSLHSTEHSATLRVPCLHPWLLLGVVPLHCCCLLPQKLGLKDWFFKIMHSTEQRTQTLCRLHRYSIQGTSVSEQACSCATHWVRHDKLPLTRHQTAVVAAAAELLHTFAKISTEPVHVHVCWNIFLSLCSYQNYNISMKSIFTNLKWCLSKLLTRLPWNPCPSTLRPGVQIRFEDASFGPCYITCYEHVMFTCGTTPPTACCIHCWLIHFCCCSACAVVASLVINFSLSDCKCCKCCLFCFHWKFTENALHGFF